MPSTNAANVANAVNCGLSVTRDIPSVINVAACSWMLISNECPGATRAAALPSLVDGFRSHDTKKHCDGYFFATAAYAASDPARALTPLSVPGSVMAATSAASSSRFGQPFLG